MANLQLTWSEQELLATDAVAEPLIASGLRCHGGYTDSGAYVSPARNTDAAIDARQLHRASSTPRSSTPPELRPELFERRSQSNMLQQGCNTTLR
jgi:hypothetical protein